MSAPGSAGGRGVAREAIKSSSPMLPSYFSKSRCRTVGFSFAKQRLASMGSSPHFTSEFAKKKNRKKHWSGNEVIDSGIPRRPRHCDTTLKLWRWLVEPGPPPEARASRATCNAYICKRCSNCPPFLPPFEVPSGVLRTAGVFSLGTATCH